MQVAWEHEQFSRQRITAVTLSQLEEAPELLQRTGGIADSRYAFSDVHTRLPLVILSLLIHSCGTRVSCSSYLFSLFAKYAGEL
jgi:hypothetical protein